MQSFPIVRKDGYTFIFRHNNSRGFFVAANCGDNSFNSAFVVGFFRNPERVIPGKTDWWFLRQMG